jgi:6-pyruvoyltetrahydropterin/6-carboxytetrahydropterin synthase
MSHRMRNTITRRFEFDAGHRVLGHEGKCANLHGHRYVAEVKIACPELDNLGRVIDFGKVKEIIGRWIDDNWDHNILLHQNDPLLKAIAIIDRQHERTSPVTDLQKRLLVSKATVEIIGRKPYVMPNLMNPTAENIAEVLAHKCIELLGGEAAPLRVVKVRIYETPNCYADYYTNLNPSVKLTAAEAN